MFNNNDRFETVYQQGNLHATRYLLIMKQESTIYLQVKAPVAVLLYW